MPRQKFQPGVTYWNPNKPPGKPPEGYSWVCVQRHPEKGYPEKWQLRSVGIENNEPPGIDELPPVGIEGELLKNPPRTMGGITAEQLEQSAKSGRPLTHADMSARALEGKER